LSNIAGAKRIRSQVRKKVRYAEKENGFGAARRQSIRNFRKLDGLKRTGPEDALHIPRLTAAFPIAITYRAQAKQYPAGTALNF
jgi:hypothetical protein